jgi:hypothetical protein
VWRYPLCLERAELEMEKSVVRALSVRQPYAEMIMRGEKTVEYRSKPTNIRERVYVPIEIRNLRNW